MATHNSIVTFGGEDGDVARPAVPDNGPADRHEQNLRLGRDKPQLSHFAQHGRR